MGIPKYHLGIPSLFRLACRIQQVARRHSGIPHPESKWVHCLGRIPRRRVVLGMDEGTLLLRLARRQSSIGSGRSPHDVLSMEFLTQSPKYHSSSLFEFRYGRNLMWYLGWMKALCFFDWRVDSLFRVQLVATRRAFNGIPQRKRAACRRSLAH